jgi:hypothetical protein
LSGGSSKTVEYQQTVGWRTDEYLVVGQVKPLNDIVLTSDQELLLKSDIVNDLASFTAFSGALIYPPVEHSTLAWFAAQVFMTNGFSTARVANFPNVGDTERLWMTQHVLNNNPDLFNVPESFEPGILFQLTQEQSYRMYSRIKYKYSLGADGRIGQAVAAPTSQMLTGPTKVTLPAAAVTAFNWMVNQAGVPSFTLPDQIQILSEIASGSSTNLVDRQGGRLAGFIGGRIGIEAQYPNYALFRRDVPFIYAETIYSLDSDKRARNQSVRLSVDKVWSRQGPETGLRFFNEIRIFRRNHAVSGAPFELVLALIFLQNPGQLRNFIMSVPLLTPPAAGAEPQPTVQNTQ